MKLPRNVFKEVFEVRFSRRMFENTFETVRPDVILGLGQHPRAHKLRIERRTYKRDHPAQARFVNLSLPHTSETTVAYDAGNYVCNYSMWVSTTWCLQNNARSGFLHIPKDYSTKRLEKYVMECNRVVLILFGTWEATNDSCVTGVSTDCSHEQMLH